MTVVSQEEISDRGAVKLQAEMPSLVGASAGVEEMAPTDVVSEIRRMDDPPSASSKGLLSLVISLNDRMEMRSLRILI